MRLIGGMAVLSRMKILIQCNESFRNMLIVNSLSRSWMDPRFLSVSIRPQSIHQSLNEKWIKFRNNFQVRKSVKKQKGGRKKKEKEKEF